MLVNYRQLPSRTLDLIPLFNCSSTAAIPSLVFFLLLCQTSWHKSTLGEKESGYFIIPRYSPLWSQKILKAPHSQSRAERESCLNPCLLDLSSPAPFRIPCPKWCHPHQITIKAKQQSRHPPQDMPTGHPDVDKGLSLFSGDPRLAFKENHHTQCLPASLMLSRPQFYLRAGAAGPYSLCQSLLQRVSLSLCLPEWWWFLQGSAATACPHHPSDG